MTTPLLLGRAAHNGAGETKARRSLVRHLQPHRRGREAALPDSAASTGPQLASHAILSDHASPSPPVCDSAIAFVDEAYLLRSGCDVLGVGHESFETDVGALVRWLALCAHTGLGGNSCERVCWYAAAFDARDPRRTLQERRLRSIARHELVQLRLGHLKEGTRQWQLDLLKALEELSIDRAKFEQCFPIRPVVWQKAVDGLIIVDLVRYAEHRAMGRALVLAGDGDLVPAVQVACEAGVRITLVTPSRLSVSAKLRELAGRLIEIPATDLRAILSVAAVRARSNRDAPPGKATGAALHVAPRVGARLALVGASPGDPPDGSADRSSSAENGQRIGSEAPGRSPLRFADRSVTTSDGSGVEYTPFVEHDHVGYIVQGPGGMTKIYLHPSRYDGAGEPTVVL